MIDQQALEIIKNLFEMVVSKKLVLTFSLDAVEYYFTPYDSFNDVLELTFKIIKKEEEINV